VYACPSRIARPADHDHSTETWHQQPGIRDRAGRSGWLSLLAIGGAGRCDRGRRDRGLRALEKSAGKWQAAKCAGPNDRSSGSSSAHRSCANGNRVRNRHSDGGVIALDSSPATPCLIIDRAPAAAPIIPF